LKAGLFFQHGRPVTRLSWSDVFSILESWKSLNHPRRAAVRPARSQRRHPQKSYSEIPMLAVVAEDFPVVCLGGSAGALEAYKDILRPMSADAGMSFVIAAHRGSEFAGLLPEILARVTAMPVIEVAEGMRLEPNCIYLMPPHQNMEMNVDKFTLRPTGKPSGWPATISHFLFSLADAYGRRAVAVILSGLSRDGSAALKTVKGAGGITFAQSNAKFDDMPKNAVGTGYVDFILPPSEIAAKLLKLKA
jgi:two-component system, chemotaxis family, CheB/CheR fusion protein